MNHRQIIVILLVVFIVLLVVQIYYYSYNIITTTSNSSSSISNTRSNIKVYLISYENADTWIYDKLALSYIYTLHQYLTDNNINSNIIIRSNTYGNVYGNNTINHCNDYNINNKCININKRQDISQYIFNNNNRYDKSIIIFNTLMHKPLIRYILNKKYIIYNYSIYIIIHEWLDIQWLSTSTIGNYQSFIDINLYNNYHIKNIIFSCKIHKEYYNLNLTKEIIIKPYIIPGNKGNDYSMLLTQYNNNKKFSINNINEFYGFNNDTIIISMYGTFDVRKNQIAFIRNVFTKIIQKDNNVHLLG